MKVDQLSSTSKWCVCVLALEPYCIHWPDLQYLTWIHYVNVIQEDRMTAKDNKQIACFSGRDSDVCFHDSSAGLKLLTQTNFYHAFLKTSEYIPW